MLNWNSHPCAPKRPTGRLPALLPAEPRINPGESREACKARKAYFAALARNPEAYAAWVQRVSR